jgi:tetratricopeptide (TPR) repeat protein
MPDSSSSTLFQKALAGQAALNEFFGLKRTDIDAIAALGFQLYEQGKVRDAEVLFDGLIALDSQVYYGYAGMGAMALAEEKLDEAVNWLERAAALNPGDPTVHANLGEALLRQARFDQAATQFGLALRLDPEQRDPGANRARAILQGMQMVIAEVRRVEAQQQE